MFTNRLSSWSKMNPGEEGLNDGNRLREYYRISPGRSRQPRLRLSLGQEKFILALSEHRILPEEGLFQFL